MVGPVVIAIFGMNLATFLVSVVISSVGLMFAFEGIMKVWTQEQFPTLLRATAQGAVISTGRFAAAVFALVTPMVLEYGTTPLYAMLAVFSLVGCGWAWLVFRTRDRHDEFAAETGADAVDVPEAAAPAT
ncbi:hypothetical protein [Agromyces sp. SYSU T00266]|uniref:hypothetical protein n=1 Tax=Agromyces zhanjiangensis TaxID=3158562 RepID=UPI003390C50C